MPEEMSSEQGADPRPQALADHRPRWEDVAQTSLDLIVRFVPAASGAEVVGEHELPTGTAYPPLDLRDGDQAAGAQVVEQECNGRLADQSRGLSPVFLDPGQVDVRDEVIGVLAREHEHLDRGSASARSMRETRSRTRSGPRRFVGGVLIPANRTRPSSRTVSVPYATGKSLAGMWCHSLALAERLVLGVAPEPVKSPR